MKSPRLATLKNHINNMGSVKERQFVESMGEGDVGEEAVAKYLADNGFHSVIITSGYNPNYDVSALRGGSSTETPSIRYTYEVKTDMYRDTGNMAIELFCLRRQKATGLFASQADWYVYIFFHNKEAWFIKTDTLIELASQYPLKGMVTNGGDNNQAVMALIPKDVIREGGYVRDFTQYLVQE